MASNSIAHAAAIDSEPIQARGIIVNNLLHGKTSLRQICALWLVLSRSGFCSTNLFHGNGPSGVFLFWSKAGKFKICNQNSEKTVNIVIFYSETYQKKLKRLPNFLVRFQRWMKKTNILRGRSVLSWTSGNFDAEAQWNRHRQKPGGQRRFYQPTEKCKLLNTNKKTATDINTRLRYIEANGMKTRKLKAYLRPSLTTFCRNLFERTKEKRRKIRADDSFQFSAQYKLTAILRTNIVSTYPRTMSSKNPGQKSPCSEAKVTCSDTNTAKGTNCKLLRPSTKTKPFFSNFEFGDPNPVALQRTVWWFSEQENYQSSDLFHRSSFCRCKLNIGSISRCTFQIFHGDVKIVQNGRKRRIVIDSDGRLTLKLCLLTMSSFEFNFHSF